jgi:hypothetical protein
MESGDGLVIEMKHKFLLVVINRQTKQGTTQQEADRIKINSKHQVNTYFNHQRLQLTP